MKLRRLNNVVFSVLVTLAMTVPVWAQTDTEPEKPKPSWVMSYVMITLCVGLALFFVCRGTKRQK